MTKSIFNKLMIFCMSILLAFGIFASFSQDTASAYTVDAGEYTYEVTYDDEDIITAMSYNVWGWNISGANDARITRLTDHILENDADVIGFQEATVTTWKTALQQRLADYTWVGERRGGSGGPDECTAIMFKTDDFELVDQETVWYDREPMAPTYTRIYTYAHLKRISDGKEFLFVNTHLDNESEEARESEVAQLHDFLEEQTLDLIITGDFNCQTSGENEMPYLLMTAEDGHIRDSKYLCAEENRTFAPNTTDQRTMHSTQGGNNKVGILDFVFVSKDTHCIDYTVGPYENTSDHYSVTSNLVFADDLITEVGNFTMTAPQITLEVGSTMQLQSQIYPTFATNQKITWSSSKSTVATVSETGLVTALKAGKVTIAALCDDTQELISCELTITDANEGKTAPVSCGSTSMQNILPLCGIILLASMLILNSKKFSKTNN